MPDDEGLREELAAALTEPTDWRGGPDSEYWLMRAGRVLAVPAIAEALAAVERVRAGRPGRRALMPRQAAVAVADGLIGPKRTRVRRTPRSYVTNETRRSR